MDSNKWTEEELKASVDVYMEMLENEERGTPYVKQKYYQELASKYNRSEKAFGYRMQNISHVLKDMGKAWVKGLAPAQNVGSKTSEKIRKFIYEYESFNSDMIRKNKSFSIGTFLSALVSSGFLFSKDLIIRFVASLLTKPFVILSGLSGSGKTKLAQSFAQWLCESEEQYCLVPVGADWTNREPLLGYPNALKPDEYIKPDNEALNLIMKANDNPNLPYFLILDEMNLSHVERYFADFLSAMESKEPIPLFAEGTVNNGVPHQLSLPDNLFIVGTVNIDETTYMFSPKVLDRANAIEFRINENEISHFLENRKEIDLAILQEQGAGMALSFLEIARNKDFKKQDQKELNETLVNFFGQLKKTGAEFGYRTASEIQRLVNQLMIIDPEMEEDKRIDIAIVQKLLPKLHGSRRKLCPVLITLGSFCTEEGTNVEKEVFDVDDFDFNTDIVKYPLSLEKIARMYRGAIENGFASFAEA